MRQRLMPNDEIASTTTEDTDLGRFSKGDDLSGHDSIWPNDSRKT